MNSKHVYLALLTGILFLNIIFAKYIVHQFYHQNYGITLIFVALNLALFPVAFLVYRKDRKNEKVQKYE